MHRPSRMAAKLGLAVRWHVRATETRRSRPRSARFVAVTTRKARGRPKLFVLTAFGRKLRGRRRSRSRFRNLRTSPQSRNVIGQSLHLGIGHMLRDRPHDLALRVLALLVVAALAGLERLQLRVRVIGVL